MSESVFRVMVCALLTSILVLHVMTYQRMPAVLGDFESATTQEALERVSSKQLSVNLARTAVKVLPVPYNPLQVEGDKDFNEPLRVTVTNEYLLIADINE
jgi:hypothetical protein